MQVCSSTKNDRIQAKVCYLNSWQNTTSLIHTKYVYHVIISSLSPVWWPRISPLGHYTLLGWLWKGYVYLNYIFSPKLNILTPSLTKKDCKKCKAITSNHCSDPIKHQQCIDRLCLHTYTTLTFYTLKIPGSCIWSVVFECNVANASLQQYFSVNLALWTEIGVLAYCIIPLATCG